MMTGVFCQREIVFDWKLENFSSLSHEFNASYSSPDFQFGGHPWFMVFYPNGVDGEQPEGCVGMYLIWCSNSSSFDARVSLGIRTAKGETEVWYETTATFDRSADCWGSGKCTERSELLRRRDELLPLDVLTLTVTLKVAQEAALEKDIKDVAVQTEVKDDVADDGNGEFQEKTGREKVLQDIENLWVSSDSFDVILKVGDVEFKAHKAILAARTPVLGAMFQHDTVEKSSSKATIEDCDPAVFEQLLHYIYKGAPSVLTAENVSALYVLADKYLVSEVKALCVRCMQETLCVDTFCSTVSLSLMHNERGLLETAIDFFAGNMLQVVETVEWQVLTRDHSTYANEILISALKINARNEKSKTSSN